MWPAWRLVKERMATKQELETTWSLDDIIDANEVLDAWADAERRVRRKAKSKKP